MAFDPITRLLPGPPPFTIAAKDSIPPLQIPVLDTAVYISAAGISPREFRASVATKQAPGSSHSAVPGLLAPGTTHASHITLATAIFPQIAVQASLIAPGATHSTRTPALLQAPRDPVGPLIWALVDDGL